jgi:hypothetical protein
LSKSFKLGFIYIYISPSKQSLKPNSNRNNKKSLCHDITHFTQPRPIYPQLPTHTGPIPNLLAALSSPALPAQPSSKPAIQIDAMHTDTIHVTHRPPAQGPKQGGGHAWRRFAGVYAAPLASAAWATSTWWMHGPTASWARPWRLARGARRGLGGAAVGPRARHWVSLQGKSAARACGGQWAGPRRCRAV